MFLLIRTQQVAESNPDAHLHSTMFLLIPGRLSLLKLFINHLHSTMFLLIHGVTAWEENLSTYLHSTMFLLIRIQISDPTLLVAIYIPLCFYLYFWAVWFSLEDEEFTFHYVSTYTSLSQIPVPVFSEFTFHYVSTYTSASPTEERILSSFTFHYVSTYTEIGWNSCIDAIIFTFHYVSTYTRTPK